MLKRNLLLLLIVPAPVALLAQPPGPPPLPLGGFQRGAALEQAADQLAARVVAEMGFGGKVVTGAPYSALAVTQNAETLADGTHINRTTTVSLARDSQGRTRRQEVSSGGTPENNALIFISDPVGQMNYVLNSSTKTAQTFAFRTPPSNPPPPRPTSQNANVVTVSLGSSTINGVAVTGTQTTRTIPVGQIGNDKPIQIVNEAWTSAELQVVVQSKHVDPRNGETDYSLTNVVRAEPDPSLFTVPPDYTVSSQARRAGRGGRGQYRSGSFRRGQ